MKLACFSILMLSLLFFSGCRKTKMTVNFVESTQKYTAAVYNSVDKYGVIHSDTTIYTNEEMTEGYTVSRGTEVKILGQSKNNYLIMINGETGYISKNFVLILDDEEDTETIILKDDGEDIIVTEKYTQIINPPDFDDDITETTASAPTTIYTTKPNNSNLSNNLAASINKKRQSNNLKPLAVDKELTNVAEYHCSIFADENKTYTIKNYRVQSVGKVGKVQDISKLGTMIASKIDGFKDDSVAKLGIAVVENGDGSAFYVVVAK